MLYTYTRCLNKNRLRVGPRHCQIQMLVSFNTLCYKIYINLLLICIQLQAQEVGKLNDVLHLTFSAQGLDNKVCDLS
jgi:hypothetical protein